MIEETATIVAIEPGYAWVKPQKKSVCHTCSSKKTCHPFAFFQKSEDTDKMRVFNPLYAKPGEEVIIGIHPKNLLLSSILAYLLPLLILIIFAIVGKELFSYLSIDSEYGAIFLGATGLFTGLWLSRLFSSEASFSTEIQPVILRYKEKHEHVLRPVRDLL